ncbi:unnamed protein product [Rhizophagus irregularis]|nr:unnamed protein product [Rhizophagus irregularis]
MVYLESILIFTFDRKEKNVSLCNISGNADVDGKGQIVDIASYNVKMGTQDIVINDFSWNLLGFQIRRYGRDVNRKTLL